VAAGLTSGDGAGGSDPGDGSAGDDADEASGELPTGVSAGTGGTTARFCSGEPVTPRTPPCGCGQNVTATAATTANPVRARAVSRTSRHRAVASGVAGGRSTRRTVMATDGSAGPVITRAMGVGPMGVGGRVSAAPIR
jgi:hypothetical protein